MKKYILFFLLLFDTVYSFQQHYHAPLEGDLARVVVPAEGFEWMMQDPLGMEALLHQRVYAAPNRFFAHWMMYTYLRTAPFVLQSFTTPIDSIYLACALFKTFIQLFILLLLAMYVCCKELKKENILLVIALLAPLFQTTGYNGLMGIIEGSITYTFFYAVPSALLLLFFFPFYRSLYVGEPLKWTALTQIFMILFMGVLALNGPLIPGVVLILVALYLVHQGKFYFNSSEKMDKNIVTQFFSTFKNHPNKILVFFLCLFALLCLYSLYIGQYNIENTSSLLSLQERFAKIPMGLLGIFIEKLGLPVLALMLIINTKILSKQSKNTLDGTLTFKQILIWAGWFALFYVLLLPFGGYRVYRPNIVRRDSLQPILLGLFFLYGLSSFLILKNKNFTYQKIYTYVVCLVAVIFTIADEPNFQQNACERAALEQLAASPEKTVLLKTDCNIMAWGKITDPNASSINTKLLKYWGVLKEDKLYYQE
ncbi:MAG: hypothetical protein RLZZ292_2370 [Bacteroidota bacterium]|jgi:hypothetical protein